MLAANNVYEINIENLLESNKSKDAWKGVKQLCASKKNGPL